MNLKLEKLNESVFQLESGKIEEAKINLKNLLENLINPQSNLDLKYTIFASALLKQFNREYKCENIYLRNFNGMSQIDVFELISERFPIVSLSHSIANESIYQITKNQFSITLLDIGIGKGIQLQKLIKNFAQNQLKPKFKIIGIDPDRSNVAEAKYRLLNIALQSNINLEFIGLEKIIENLTQKEWLNLTSHSNNLIVNSSFALHHTINTKRQEVIKKISHLNPKALIISEPDSDHNTSDLSARFNNAWNHFNLVFDMIDHLPINKLQIYLLKECFLGREIEDILGNKESFRSERHESTSNWLQRFYQEGFKSFNPLKLTTKNVVKPQVKINNKKKYIGLEYKNTNLASIICLTK